MLLLIHFYRYKESITKSTRGWKDRFFSRNSTAQDLGSEGRRESDTGLATMTDMMEHLETRDSSRNNIASVSNSQEDSPTPVPSEQQQHVEVSANHSLRDDGVQAPCATSSTSN